MGYPIEVTSSLSTKDAGLSSTMPRWQVIILALLTAWLYATILGRLVMQWVGPHHDPNFEHGIFVPLFALFVVWQRRGELKVIPANPSWAGLPLVSLSLLTLVVGNWGAENFLSRVSFLILIAGLIILFRGWAFFRAVLFPWSVLILMIPIPSIVIQQVTFPLQLLASKLATGMLQLFGVPVLRQGNMIVLAAMPLDVAEACSGIRSLLTLVTLAIIYGYLMETRNWVRVVLACCAVPIAVVANSFRVFGTGMLVQFWDPDKAEGFFHTFQGLLIFVVALMMLLAVHRLICLIWKSAPAANGASAKPENHFGAPPQVKNAALRFGMTAVLLLVTASALQAHARGEYFPPRAAINSLPSQIDGWTGTDEPLDQQTLDILGPGDFLMREYENGNQPSIDVYLAYFPTQKAGDTIHSPNHCLPGSGWVPTSREIVWLSNADGASFPVNRYVVSKSGERLLVLYWFQAHGRAVASEYWAKYYLVADAIRMNRSDGGLVRLITPMAHDESAEAAQARIMQLGSKLIPMLDQYIPR